MMQIVFRSCTQLIMIWLGIILTGANAESNKLAYLEKHFPYLPRSTHINPFGDIERLIANKRNVIDRVYRNNTSLLTRDADFDDSIEWDDYQQTRCGLVADTIKVPVVDEDAACTYSDAASKLECFEQFTPSLACRDDLEQLKANIATFANCNKLMLGYCHVRGFTNIGY